MRSSLLLVALALQIVLALSASAQSFQDSLFAALTNMSKTNSPTSQIPSTNAPTNSGEDVILTPATDPPEVDTSSPTSIQDISTALPTTAATVSPTVVVVVPVETLVPTTATSSPTTTAVVIVPGETVAPTTATSSPTVAAVVVVPGETVAPTAATSSPTITAVVIVPDETVAPTTATSSPTVAAVVVVPGETAAPTTATSSPTVAAVVVVPGETTNATTSSPTATAVVVVPGATTNATTSSPTATAVVVVPGETTNATTSSPTATAVVAETASPTSSPTASSPPPIASNLTNSNATSTYTPTSLAPLNATHAPTQANSTFIDRGYNGTTGAEDGFGNSTSNATAILYNCTQYPEPTVQFWDCSAQNQLTLFEIAGEAAEQQALSLLLALFRICEYKGNETTLEQALQLRLALHRVEENALPNLRTNRSASEELILIAGSERKGALASELRSAISSSLVVIHALEHLVDIAAAVGNASSHCLTHFTPQAQQVNQYQLQYHQDEVSTTSIVLASLMGVLGLLLLVLPSPAASVVVYAVSASYVWGFAAYMAAWYSFGLMEVLTWQSDNWWRAYYASYLIGLAAWLLALCVLVMARNVWLAAGALAGIGFGGVLGIQLNTIALWRFGEGFVPYFTISICLGGGALLGMMGFLVWASIKPSYAIFHLVAVHVGAYFLIKMVGVLVGSYPNELMMDQYSSTYEDNAAVYAYIIAMWILAIFLFTFQSCFYPIWRLPLAGSGGDGARDSKKYDGENDSYRGSTSNGAAAGSGIWSRKKAEEDSDRAPLLTPSEARRRKQEEEVIEFGGVRALKSEGGHSTKSLLV